VIGVTFQMILRKQSHLPLMENEEIIGCRIMVVGYEEFFPIA